MALPEVVGRDEWLAARRELLEREKAARRELDRVNAERRRLPMVRIDKPYRFEGASGTVGLAELFEGRPQLIVQHVMFGPDWDAACPSCTAGIDEMAPALLAHLANRGTTFALVSRAPYAKLAEYAAARGWRIPWYSSAGDDFNFDFAVSFDEAVQPPVYNYRALPVVDTSELPGVSCFLAADGAVFHTYSTYARGTDFGGAYAWLDLTALGRQEEWEEPKGRVDHARAAVPDFAV
ncbi:DUF899 domain-containing protein [Dactylosporangium sp. CS-047395]|uniref:DUF899 domain-containing protein n=1 Tax=Dactylosporangium sp. CS-047395 TaxID=3239936 RepID=UPI003D9049EF